MSEKRIKRDNDMRNELQWLMVLRLLKSGKTLQATGDMLGFTRQRVHQIRNLAKVHAKKHNDELAAKIRELLK